MVRNRIDFGTLEFDADRLSSGGALIFDEGTLGGSSVHSEVFAFEVLHRCELAALVKTETTIDYVDPAGKKTDILVDIDGFNVGVSVTRAFHWPPDEPYSLDDAVTLLQDKLLDVQLSSANAADSNRWDHSVLHVIAYNDDHANRIEEAHETIDSDRLGATAVVVTTTDGNDAFIY